VQGVRGVGQVLAQLRQRDPLLIGDILSIKPELLGRFRAGRAIPLLKGAMELMSVPAGEIGLIRQKNENG
jgi:hypothetical protein